MDKSGVYIVSAKSIDPDASLKNRSEGQVNVGFEDSEDLYKEKTAPSNTEVKFKEKDGVHFNVDKTHPVSDAPYRGMGKEDLLRHSSKPLWRRMRYVCMSIILLGWLALIITVVALVLIYPRCRSHLQQDWWQKAVVYRVYVPSFQDSGDDGVGDLKGLMSRLDYLSEIGVNTISLSPIYLLKTNADTDFDIVDHKSLDPRYGTMAEFQNLVNETHSRDMYIILDFIPNQTSDDHPWFQLSKNKTDKKNYYVWESGALPNWKSKYGPSAWQMDTQRKESYLHQFRMDQPDLNLRSAEVKDELKSILRYWLDEGVDGFFIRDSAYLFEDYDLRDEPSSNTPGAKNAYDRLNHTYTYGLPEVYDMIARWRYFLDEYGNQTHRYRMLFADIDGSQQKVMSYYGYFNRDGVDFPLNRFCLDLKDGDNGKIFNGLVSGWMDNLPGGNWPNWMGGDENSNRMIGRLGGNMTRAFLILATMLPGTPFFYYGDEIGMVNSVVTPSNPWSKNQPMRSPMQWDNSTHAGFVNDSACSGSCNPWMPVNSDHDVVSVQFQNSSYDSIFHLFKNLTKLRKSPSLVFGDYTLALHDHDVFSFVREFDGEKGYLVAINFGSSSATRDYTGSHNTIPGGASVEITTGNGIPISTGSGVSCSDLTLGPYQGVVVSWDYVAKEL